MAKNLQISDQQLQLIIANVKDYQLTHGSLLKNVRQEEAHTVQARPVGLSLFPTYFPKVCYEQAVRLQKQFNELYAKVSSDEAWLEEKLGSFLHQDAFAKVLWQIHRDARLGPNRMPQSISLGIFRSDYMIHENGKPLQNQPQLRQVEFNAFSCAGATHANIIAKLHRHLHRTGAYGTRFGDYRSEPAGLPKNNGIEGIINGLEAAHNAYLATAARDSRTTGILFVVQPFNTNIADERPLEYALWERKIPTYRVIFGQESLEHTTIGQHGELLFDSPACPFSPLEISVVYLRAGYELEEYNDAGLLARLRFEQSCAIKVPSVLSHLTTFKKVQEQLTSPGALEHFIQNGQDCADLRSTFMPIYPLDDSKAGRVGRKLALDTKTAMNHVLKPSLEGGGHNVYGADIPAFLKRLPKREWSNFILMEKIHSPTQNGMLMSFRGRYEGPVLSELGVVGACLWRSGDKPEVLYNEQVGWTFKSKPDTVNEMSVVKGYGCFDSPWLGDHDDCRS